MSSTSPYIQKENVTAAASHVNGALWADFKRCLMQRRPAAPDINDTAEVSAAKGHQRTGFEKCIEEIEALPFETPQEIVNPMDRPAIQETID